MNKRCSACREYKEFHEFNRSAAAKDGLQNQCRECNLAANAEWYTNNYWNKLSPETHRLHRRISALLERSQDPAKFSMKVFLWLLVPHGKPVANWTGFYGKADDVLFHAEDAGLIDDFNSSGFPKLLSKITDRSVAAQWCRLLRKQLDAKEDTIPCSTQC